MAALSYMLLLGLYLHKDKCIPFQVAFELPRFELQPLWRSQGGLLVQLFYLRLVWIKRFTHRGIFWQDIAVFVVHPLYRYLRIWGHVEKLKLHRLRSTAILGIDEIPQSKHQGGVLPLRHTHVE